MLSPKNKYHNKTNAKAQKKVSDGKIGRCVLTPEGLKAQKKIQEGWNK